MVELLSARGLDTESEDMCRSRETEENDSLTVSIVEKKSCASCCRSKRCQHHVVLCLLMLSMAAGVGLGVVLRGVPPFDQPKLNPKALTYLKFPGDLLIRFMMCLCLPLIVTSLISGIASVDAKTCGRVGMRTVVFYVGTTICAVTEGFIFVSLIKPGVGLTFSDREPILKEYGNVDALLDMIRNIFPDNLVEAAFHSAKTRSFTKEVVIGNGTNNTHVVEDIVVEKVVSINILGLAFLSILLGIVLASMNQQARPLVDVITVLFDAIMKIMTVLIWLYPISIISFVSSVVITMDNPLDQLFAMGWFLITVLAGLFTHFFLILPIIYIVMVRRNPFKYMLRCLKALITAFTTGNSNATLPMTMECLENNAGISSVITKFMCPLGATINMDGTALYEAVAVIFLATLRGMTCGPMEYISIGVTSVVLSIGAPTVGGGLAFYAILLKSVGLPVEDCFILLPFDVFLTRFRTATNVWGDCVGCEVVQRLSEEELKALSYEEVRQDDKQQYKQIGNGAQLFVPKQNYTLTLHNEGGDVMKVSKV